jgi:hypothetical protein
LAAISNQITEPEAAAGRYPRGTLLVGFDAGEVPSHDDQDPFKPSVSYEEIAPFSYDQKGDTLMHQVREQLLEFCQTLYKAEGIRFPPNAKCGVLVHGTMEPSPLANDLYESVLVSIIDHRIKHFDGLDGDNPILRPCLFKPF